MVRPMHVLPALAVGGAALLSATTVIADELELVGAPATATERAVRGDMEQIRPIPASQPPTARYRVTITQTWDGSTHPGTLPPNPHTSPAVLAAHGRAGDLFASGTFASAGIEQMAETGGTSILRAELAANPTVSAVIGGRGIDTDATPAFNALGEVEVTQEHAFLSLVTMLAPSPDWFIGFSDVSVFGQNGWEQRIVLDLGSYDAGTDSGVGFTSGDIDTQPRELISGPRDAPFQAAAAQNRFGFAVIERIG
ncbi:MAG: spondin domain-containing protein [Actinomycetota bacterium]